MGFHRTGAVSPLLIVIAVLTPVNFGCSNFGDGQGVSYYLPRNAINWSTLKRCCGSGEDPNRSCKSCGDDRAFYIQMAGRPMLCETVPVHYQSQFQNAGTECGSGNDFGAESYGEFTGGSGGYNGGIFTGGSGGYNGGIFTGGSDGMSGGGFTGGSGGYNGGIFTGGSGGMSGGGGFTVGHGYDKAKYQEGYLSGGGGSVTGGGAGQLTGNGFSGGIVNRPRDKGKNTNGYPGRGSGGKWTLERVNGKLTQSAGGGYNGYWGGSTGSIGVSEGAVVNGDSSKDHNVNSNVNWIGGSGKIRDASLTGGGAGGMIEGGVTGGLIAGGGTGGLITGGGTGGLIAGGGTGGLIAGGGGMTEKVGWFKSKGRETGKKTRDGEGSGFSQGVAGIGGSDDNANSNNNVNVNVNSNSMRKSRKTRLGVGFPGLTKTRRSGTPVGGEVGTDGVIRQIGTDTGVQVDIYGRGVPILSTGGGGETNARRSGKSLTDGSAFLYGGGGDIKGGGGGIGGLVGMGIGDQDSNSNNNVNVNTNRNMKGDKFHKTDEDEQNGTDNADGDSDGGTEVVDGNTGNVPIARRSFGNGNANTNANVNSNYRGDEDYDNDYDRRYDYIVVGRPSRHRYY